MGNTRRTSGVVTMISGGIMQVAAFMFIGLMEAPFPMALILLGGGALLIVVGAALHSRRLDPSFQAPQPREWLQYL